MQRQAYALTTLLVFLGFCLLSFQVDSAELNFAQAINKAGRQRMLTQRISKSYCQIGLGVLAEQSRRQLEDAVDLFARQLQELQQSAVDGEVIRQLEKVDALWRTFRSLATGTPTAQAAVKLAALDEQLLQASEAVVQSLQDRSGAETSRLVNISGRQRMLSQRLAKFYMLQSWGLGNSALRDHMERAANEFKGALDTLRSAPENTLVIREKLDAAALQWSWLSGSLKLNTRSEYFPLIVVDASEKMLAIMESLTGLYQQVAENE